MLFSCIIYIHVKTPLPYVRNSSGYVVYWPLFLNTFIRVGQKHDPVFHFFPDFRKDFPTIIKRYEKFLISFPQRKNVQ